MKTKSTEMKQETEKRFKKYCADENVPYKGCPMVSAEGFTEEYLEVFAEFEKKLQNDLNNTVCLQNTVYYQMKTQETTPHDQLSDANFQ